jgi:hypothetical protein
MALLPIFVDANFANVNPQMIIQWTVREINASKNVLMGFRRTRLAVIFAFVPRVKILLLLIALYAPVASCIAPMDLLRVLMVVIYVDVQLGQPQVELVEKNQCVPCIVQEDSKKTARDVICADA